MGDFVEIEFVGRIKSTNEIFDLTSEDLARKEGLYSKDHEYKPAFVIIGNHMVIPGVEKELEGMKVGEERTFDVSPKDGFGFRSPKLIKIISLSKFLENRINPVPGTFVNIDGMNAKVQSVSGGRVRVDFNNPLAGKELTYKVKILRKIEKNKEKVEKIFKYYKINYNRVDLDPNKGKVKVYLKEINFALKGLIERTIVKWIGGVKKVEFVTEETNVKQNFK
jgi:FKBP-type peptidyl-prolyl cis-trans isomerase 2